MILKKYWLIKYQNIFYKIVFKCMRIIHKYNFHTSQQKNHYKD